jgi:hypothetical protein
MDIESALAELRQHGEVEYWQRETRFYVEVFRPETMTMRTGVGFDLPSAIDDVAKKLLADAKAVAK